MLKLSLLAAAAATLPTAYAQSALYGQCGGIGWTGATTCVSGAVCKYVNDWYSQCVPGTSTSTTTTTGTTTTSTSTSPAATNAVCGSGVNLTKLKYVGVNEAGAEFGQTVWPGALGTEYIWPAPSSIDYFVNQGWNTFRIAFLMERLSPPSTGLAGAFNQTYLQGLKDTVSYVTGKSAYAIIDPHNFLHYNNGLLTNTTLFQTWWTKLAAEFKSNTRVIFDLQNEPYDIAATTVASMMQAGINGVRAGGATSQLILVEGTSWSGAWTWTTSSGNAAAFAGKLTDPNNNFAIEMHQYLDSDGSGTSGTCVSTTIGKERVAAASAWLKTNNLKGFLGEYGGGANSVCQTAIQGMLCDLQSSGVWLGALFWSAGPWWGTYFQSMEPTTGAALPLVAPIKAALA